MYRVSLNEPASLGPILSEERMGVVENSIDIDRPAEEVFDYCSDMRTEVEWNPTTKTIDLVTAEPVGKGSRFIGAWSGLGRVSMEVVEYARPSSWTTQSIDSALPFRVIGTVVAEASGSTRLTMRIEILPKGIMKPLGPVIKLLMKRTATANVARIKKAVER
jgi:Polyketide cyclase / dehydrase and lipid transport